MNALSYHSHFSEAAVIEMIEVCDDWYVRVLDQHGRQTVSTFRSEKEAIRFAEDELHRLGAEEIHRL